jgi:hypothetical protein
MLANHPKRRCGVSEVGKTVAVPCPLRKGTNQADRPRRLVKDRSAYWPSPPTPTRKGTARRGSNSPKRPHFRRPVIFVPLVQAFDEASTAQQRRRCFFRFPFDSVRAQASVNRVTMAEQLSSQRLHASERRAPDVGPPGAIKMVYMVGHFDRLAGPRSLRQVVAVLELAYLAVAAVVVRLIQGRRALP